MKRLKQVCLMVFGFTLLCFLMFLFACSKKEKLTALITGPVISQVASTVTTDSVTITWSTDVVATSQVYYGNDLDFENKTSETDIDANRTKDHSVNISGLSANTTYYYYVLSRNENGKSTSGENGNYSFTTAVQEGPVISLVSATPSDNGAKITWATNEDATSEINYGTSVNYGFKSKDTTLTKSHNVSIDGLIAGTKYHYNIKSTNAAGKTSTSSDANFTTTGTPPTPTWPAAPANGEVYMETDGGAFISEGELGYDMGADSSGRMQAWASEQGGYMQLSYPTGQTWGAVFIIRWPPPWQNDGVKSAFDFSDYTKLSVDLKGQSSGESVKIGIKDIDDLDDGKEIKKLASLTTDWKTFTYNLSDFKSNPNDLKKIYVAIEFVWDGVMPAQTIFFKNVKYHN